MSCFFCIVSFLFHIGFYGFLGFLSWQACLLKQKGMLGVMIQLICNKTVSVAKSAFRRKSKTGKEADPDEPHDENVTPPMDFDGSAMEDMTRSIYRPNSQNRLDDLAESTNGIVELSIDDYGGYKNNSNECSKSSV